MFSSIFFMDWIFIFISGPYGVCRVALKSPDFGIKRYEFKTCLFSILPMWPWKNTICLLWSYCLRLAHHNYFFFLIYILIVNYKRKVHKTYTHTLLPFFNFCIYLVLVALGLHCYIEWRLLSVAAHRLLIAVASLNAEHGLEAHGLQWLQLAGSRAWAQ